MAGFDKDALERGRAQCDKNIKVFEDAIAEQQATKAEYARMIRFIEDQEQALALAKRNVKLEVVEIDDTEV